MSAFDVMLEAIVYSFFGCRMRIGLGACFFDVLRQLGRAFACSQVHTKLPDQRETPRGEPASGIPSRF